MFAFLLLKLLFPSTCCWYFSYYLRNIIHFQVSNYIFIYTINAVPFHYLWYGVINERQFTDKTLTLRQSTYRRASEHTKFSHFYIDLKLLFLSIFCWYLRYFVGTNDMLVGLHVPTDFQMYRQNSEKALLGCPPPPPPHPSGYSNEAQ